MDSIQTTLTELRAELQRQRAEIQRQRDEITILRSRPDPRPKPVLPDPDKFTGQALKFDTWLPSIKAKLRVDGTAIGDPVAQFYYVYLNLDSNAQAMVLPQLGQSEASQSWNYQTILDQLSRVYDNPNKVQEAEDKLYDIKQGSDSIPTYIAKFERVLYEARGQDWPDVNKISAFRNGLSPMVRNRLRQQLNLPALYPAFLRVVQQLSGRSIPSSAYPPSNSGPTHTSDPMDITQISTIDDRPNDSPRARSISPVQRQRYREQGKCVRCGSSDHWVKDCNLQAYSAKPKSGRVVISALDDDSYDEGDTSDLDYRLPDSLDWKKHVKLSSNA